MAMNSLTDIRILTLMATLEKSVLVLPNLQKVASSVKINQPNIIDLKHYTNIVISYEGPFFEHENIDNFKHA